MVMSTPFQLIICVIVVRWVPRKCLIEFLRAHARTRLLGMNARARAIESVPQNFVISGPEACVHHQADFPRVASRASTQSVCYICLCLHVCVLYEIDIPKRTHAQSAVRWRLANCYLMSVVVCNLVGWATHEMGTERDINERKKNTEWGYAQKRGQWMQILCGVYI